MLKLYLLPLLLFLAACANPYRSTNRQYRQQVKQYAKILRQYPLQDSAGIQPSPQWVGTVNFSMRKPNFVVIHHTAQDHCNQTLKTFTLQRTQVSAHYVICKDGTLHHMLNDYLRAWHAGAGKWGNVTDLNSVSVGIELDNNGKEPFPEAQMQTLYVLSDRLKRAYNIPAENFIGHADLAPTRKNDPNINFNWKEMAHKGFGKWYSDTTGVVLPPDFNAISALRLIGYDLRDTNAVIVTFKRKFLQEEKDTTLSESAKKVLYLLSR